MASELCSENPCSKIIFGEDAYGQSTRHNLEHLRLSEQVNQPCLRGYLGFLYALKLLGVTKQ